MTDTENLKRVEAYLARLLAEVQEKAETEGYVVATGWAKGGIGVAVKYAAGEL